MFEFFLNNYLTMNKIFFKSDNHVEVFSEKHHKLRQGRWVSVTASLGFSY